MKRGKDEEKTMGPMFPRLHVNDTEKGGPRAPPRNKMALYEQLSIPSQRFNGGGGLPNHLPPSSSTPGAAMNERGTNPAIQQSIPTRKRDTHHSDFSNQRVHPEHKRRQEDDDFRVPVFDQQSGTSQNRSVNVNANVNHRNRENEGITSFGGVRLANVQNARQSNRFQKENSQDFARSASNQSSRQNVKAPLKETNESSSFSHRNVSNNSSRLQSNGNLRDYDNGMWGDNEASKVGFGNASVPVREVEQEAARSPPNDPTNADAVSETSMVDSICGVDISPDDVVGIIGQKHFWKARRAIVNQQRVFAVQVFELHRLIKVQRLIAGSPHLLVEDNAFLAKPPKVSPIKKLPLEYVLKSTVNTPKHKSDIEKPNEDTEFSAENAVGKASLSSVQNDSHTPNYRPFTGNPLPPPEPNMGGSWNFNPPPGHQWLIPVMTPSEGLVYKPYPGPGFMNPLYGGCGPPGPPPGAMPMIGHNFPNYGVPPDHHYEGPPGGHPFVPPASHGYFPAYGMPPMVNPSVSSSQCEQTNTFNPHHQNSSNVPIEKKGPAVPNVVKFKAFKDSDVQASTASSRSDRTRGRNALNLFPTSPPAPPSSPPTAPAPAPQAPAPQAPAPAAAPAPARFEAAEPARVIRVVPHNARSATASVARIFRSIQEERKQYDSG